ncbi:MAG: DoxX family membrane protein [Bacteroidetes bacterium]|nr:DoxX family membrane protein [Bacteroidota bacterium]
MKAIINITRIIVGVLFIFSGLVKANDPLGLSYKMQEFFEIWNEGLMKSSFFLAHTLVNLFDFFHSHSLALSVIMIAFEIIAGVALLLGWRMKLFSWLLLLLIIFFTFLTGYAFLSGKFKNCGCFGDCLPITPLTSFLKDVLLTLLIFFLFYHRNKIKPLFAAKTSIIAMLVITVFSFGIQWYALSYLPFKDCLPFKVGNNIPEQMKMPANAIPDSTVITFIYQKDGKNVEFTADKFPADFSADKYKYIDRVDKVIRKGINNEPPIKGLSFSGITDEDSTMTILNEPYSVLLFDENFETPVKDWQNGFLKVYGEIKKKNIPVYIITTAIDAARKNLDNTALSGIPVLKCDYTVIRTAARTKPAMYLLKEGTVLNKWSYKRFADAVPDLEAIPSQPRKEDIAMPPIDQKIQNTDSVNHQQ